MNHKLIGLDLAKTVFHLISLDTQGNPLQRKKLSRAQLIRYASNLEPTCIAMEACGSAHYWGRLFESMGHRVVLLPAQHVKAYRRGQKNDHNDALAIAEAGLQDRIRPVPIKSVQQQDEQAIHRIRCQIVGEKVRLINQVRGLLAEYGVVFAQRESAFREGVARLLDGDNTSLSPTFKTLLQRQYLRFLELNEEIAWYTQLLEQHAKQDETCCRLREIPGFGALTSTAFKSWIGNGHQFKRGRDASAALGLVPKQHSTGGKPILLGITKRGDSYLRMLLVNGARAVLRYARTKSDRLSLWVQRLERERGAGKTIVALANKLVRIAWVLVARQEHYVPA